MPYKYLRYCPPNTRFGCIYAIEHSELKYVKLGFAKDPIRRAASLQAGWETNWPYKQRGSLAIMGWVPDCCFTIERRLHKEFPDTKVPGPGEWHKPNSPAVAWVLDHDLFLKWIGPHPTDPVFSKYTGRDEKRMKASGLTLDYVHGCSLLLDCRKRTETKR
jgi:hypothetical protein